MKTTLNLLCAVLLLCLQVHAADAPRYEARITCFNGEVDKASHCSGPLDFEGAMTCGLPEQISEIKWKFVGRRGDKDVYQFRRHFPVDAFSSAVATKEVEFSGSRVIVFQDSAQVIVVDPAKD